MPAAPPHRGDLHPSADRRTRSFAPSSRSASPSTTTGRWRACRWTSPRRRCRPSCACRRRSARARWRPPTSRRPRTTRPRPRPSRRRRGASSSARARIRRFPHVRQLDAMDCGAAALAMVCRHYGRAVSLARIRQLCFTSTDGTSLRALCRAADRAGPGGPARQGVHPQPAADAAAGHRALGGQPLGRALRRDRQSRTDRRPRAWACAGWRAPTSSASGAATPRCSTTPTRSPGRRWRRRAPPGSGRSCGRSSR